jgi:hypothetical protein
MAVSLQAVGSDLRCIDESGTVHWTVSVDDIILVAEYTTDEGPLADDYYLIFCTIEAGRAVFATSTFYANGRDAALRTLADRLGSPMALVLSASTVWASRVLWPPDMAEQEYFTFKTAEPNNILERLGGLVFGPATECFLSDPVQHYIRAQLKSRASKMTPP